MPGRVFVDPDFSASRYARRERPDYAALLEHIRSRTCEMVALWECTRGSRQMGEWVVFLDLCRDYGVLIRIFGEDEPTTYDPRRQRDREYLMKEGMAAEAEVERLRNRILPGQADAAQEGRPPGPMLHGYKRLYGGRTEESTSASGHRRREIEQVVDEAKAPLVRQLVQDTLDGVPFQEQARRLNAAGVPTPSGRGLWTGVHIRRMILNPGYEGHRVHNGVIVARDVWPAIIDPDDAATLRVMLSTRHRSGYSDPRLTYQLTGAVLCGLCRRKLKSGTSKGVKRYECGFLTCKRTAAPMAAMDVFVESLVQPRLRSEDAARLFEAPPNSAAMDAARAELRVLQDRRDELYAEAANPGGPSMALVAATERTLLPKIGQAEQRLRQLQVPPVLSGFDPVELADHWPDVPVGVRRSVIVGLAELVLSPVGRGVRWSPVRLGESRWRGDDLSWGERWAVAGSR